MLKYIDNLLHRFQHPRPKNKNYAPYPYTPIKYGQHIQKTITNDITLILSSHNKIYVQQAVRELLYYAQAINCTILVAFSKIAYKQAQPTQNILN